MRTSIDLKRLQHLELLAEELNFSRAAERAHLSQTAFSRSIQALENEFGLRLFDRDTRSVRPTSAGHYLIAKAKVLLHRARDLSDDIYYLAHAEVGELNFGTSLLAIDGPLRPALVELKQQCPRLKLHIEASQTPNLMHHLEQENIEFFVAFPGELAQDERLEVTWLPTEPGSMYCRPEHPLLQQGTPPSPHQLPDYPWSAVFLDHSVAPRLRRLFGMRPNQPLPLELTCDNLSILRDLTLCSDNILFTWESWINRGGRHAGLVNLGALLQPALPAKDLHIECAIVQLAGRTLSPPAQRLVDLILAQAGMTSVSTAARAP
ncbi:LysR family transcriptional regulator [Pseudomonas sp. GLN_6]|uniref:LysR family transcriptional regulator n=1 Tax=Pseudomonas sp. GLN_6 TaxID=3367183 RepID=UPI00370A1E23